MLSIGDWVDKLVIENIKIFTMRDKMNSVKNNVKQYVVLYDNVMRMNENRNKIMNALDEKVEDVVSGRKPNMFIERIRTYNLKEMNE